MEPVSVVVAGVAAAMVQAAGTDAWAGFRQRIAGWFGRGDTTRTSTELDRLDATAAALTSAEADAAVAAEQHIVWRTRIEEFLASLAEAERERAVEALRALLASEGDAPTEPTGQAAFTAGKDVNIKASGRGSVAAGVIQGGASTGNPLPPGPPQG